MENDDIINAEIKRLKALYTAMLTGCIAFLAIAYYVNRTTGGFFKNNKELCLTFSYIAILLLGLLPLSYYLFKRKVGKLIPAQDFFVKLMIYRSAYFIKLTIIETACFFSIVIFLLTNIQYILYQTLMILVVMFINYPYKSQMITDLKLQDEEKEYSE